VRTREPLRRSRSVVPDLFEQDISVDLFAGGGGASVGTEAALGKHVTIAINHDPVAIAVHADNHPATEHYTADIFEVDPTKAVRGRHVRHLHASPDCRHHSRAAGGKPKSESVRSLADVVVVWAAAVKPDVITLENVAEFEGWGPLDRKGKPIKARKGETFRRWKRDLEAVGYVVEHRVLHAHHFGAPTSRKRFFLVARIDGEPIAWPQPTHGPGLKKYRTAAECIDWSLPCRSIFEREKPLADATLRRVAVGVVRFVLNNPRPFIVKVNHQGKRGAESIDKPLTTVTAQRRGHAIVVPTLVQTGYGERPGQKPRVLDLHEPLGTVVGCGQKHGLVTSTLVPFIAGCGGRAAQSQPTSGDAPVGTITSKNDRVVVAAQLAVLRNNCDAKSLDEPLPTVCASGNHLAEVRTLLAPFIAQHYQGQVGHELTKPLPTITAIDHHSVVEVTAAELPPGMTAGHAHEIRAFLTTYYGSEFDLGQDVRDPLRTVTTHDRFALVTVTVDGVTYAIVDIGLRMLEPHELLRAQFGTFAKGYQLRRAKTKKDKVRLVGNSVVPQMQEAVVRANLGPSSRPMRRAA
jgi:DNA (cytosine-5)-methyltransferase 1